MAEPSLHYTKEGSLGKLQLENISHFAFLFLAGRVNCFYQIKKTTDQFYAGDNLQNDHKYQSLLHELRHLRKQTTLKDVWPCGRLINAEFAGTPETIKNLVLIASRSFFPELRTIAELAAKELKIEPEKQNNLSEMEIERHEYDARKNQLQILDIDNSFENKLLFYNFFQNDYDPLPRITDKVEFLSFAKKGEILENIFEKDQISLLPKIITNHIFCTIKIINDLNALETLLAPEFNILLQNPNAGLGFNTPSKIINSAHHEAYLTVMEKIKNYYFETQNFYIIPRTFRQLAIISLNLNSFKKLQKINSGPAEEIMTLLKSELDFLKY